MKRPGFHLNHIPWREIQVEGQIGKTKKMALPRPLLKTTAETRQTSSEKSFAVVALSSAPGRVGGLTTGPGLSVAIAVLVAIITVIATTIPGAARTVPGSPARSQVSDIVSSALCPPATAGMGLIGSLASCLGSLTRDDITS